MTTSLATISSVFSPLTSSTSGQNFLLARDSKDPYIDTTLALGKALSNAMGNAQIKQAQGSSYLAANTAVTRIQAQIAAAKQAQAEKAKASLAALDIFTKNHTVNKTV